MTFEKLVQSLNFDTGDADILNNTDENIEKSFPGIYEKLAQSYLLGIDACVLLIRSSALEVGIHEELLGLWFMLRLSLSRMYPEYKKRGISDEYFIAAVANSRRYANASRDFTGKFGIIIDRYVRALSNLVELRAFRVGDFNFEFIEIDRNIEVFGESIKPGDVCLSVHIPINTDISDANVDKNFLMAKDFFKAHFGMEKPFCQLYSWLIHPSIEECLPEDSKLVKFYKRFFIYEVKNAPISPIEYVFGMKYAEDYERENESVKSFPENTSLQRKFKERLIKGLPIGCAKGMTLL